MEHASFYDIKPLEDWLTDDFFLYDNKDAFVTLSVFPCSFGHALVIPKRIVSSTAELSPLELHNFEQAKHAGREILEDLIENNPQKIMDAYATLEQNTTLLKQFPIQERLDKIKQHDGSFYGISVYENHGQGRLIEHFHVHLAPRVISEKEGVGEALFRYLHQNNP